jgi:hypothetical protein
MTLTSLGTDKLRVATNNKTQANTKDVQKLCAIRWKIEQFPREVKQLTGIEYCQCRQAIIQINPIACHQQVWGWRSKVEPIKLVK